MIHVFSGENPEESWNNEIREDSNIGMDGVDKGSNMGPESQEETAAVSMNASQVEVYEEIEIYNSDKYNKKLKPTEDSDKDRVTQDVKNLSTEECDRVVKDLMERAKSLDEFEVPTTSSFHGKGRKIYSNYIVNIL